MIAGFERHISRSSACPFTRSLEGIYLGMGFTRKLMPALANDLALINDDTAHAGIGIRGPEPPSRQFQCTGHMACVFS